MQWYSVVSDMDVNPLVSANLQFWPYGVHLYVATPEFFTHPEFLTPLEFFSPPGQYIRDAT